MILLAGAPVLAFALYLPMLLSQVLFGAFSAFVSLAVLDRLFRRSTADSGSPVGVERLNDPDHPESQQAGTGRGIGGG